MSVAYISSDYLSILCDADVIAMDRVASPLLLSNTMARACPFSRRDVGKIYFLSSIHPRSFFLPPFSYKERLMI